MSAQPLRIKLKVVPGAKVCKIKQEQDYLKIYVNSAAVDGKANASVIDSLSKYFAVKKSAIQIVSGLTSRTKVVEIDQ